MRILALGIRGFRGVEQANIVFSDHTAIVGPNGAGKSTIIDALSLVFARSKLVQTLTEHDFFGSKPVATSRILITATVAGFKYNDPDKCSEWFRHGRGVPKWWSQAERKALAAPSTDEDVLCVQIGFAARFDLEDLAVEQVRYFCDDDACNDPFDEDSVTPFPMRLLNEIGFYVLPARRTWEAAVSFGSELFRKAVATAGGIPAATVLAHRDELRRPASPLEADPDMKPLVDSINGQLAHLLPGNPKFQLRLTATDSDSLLRALVPHYEGDDGAALPAGRHGTGLLSIQTFVLLVETGRARRAAGQSFILALEEPELHVPPGLQRRLLGQAAAVAEQTICTTHAPRVAACFPAWDVLLLSKTKGHLQARRLADHDLVNARNAVVQLFTDDRAALIEALMFPRIIIPEGRTDFEWLRHLLNVVETGERPLDQSVPDGPPFGAVVGIVPTRDSHVVATYERLRSLRDGFLMLVDGDQAGDQYIKDLIGSSFLPEAVAQWPAGWVMEDVVGWVLRADPEPSIAEINQRLAREFTSVDEILLVLKNKDGKTGGIKEHYGAHEEIASAIRRYAKCVDRAEVVLDSLTRMALGTHAGSKHIALDPRGTVATTVLRFVHEPIAV